jgi:hypothetical protein
MGARYGRPTQGERVRIVRYVQANGRFVVRMVQANGRLQRAMRTLPASEITVED